MIFGCGIHKIRIFFKKTNFCMYGGVKVTTKMYGGYEGVLGGVDTANLP